MTRHRRDFAADHLVAARVTDIGGHEELLWAKDLIFNLPRAVVETINGGPVKGTSLDITLPPDLPHLSQEVVSSLRLLTAFTLRKPLSSRLPFSYQIVPESIRSVVAGLIGRCQQKQMHKWGKYPAWPLDLSADFLADLITPPAGVPCTQKTPVLLTHDIDSLEGLHHLVKRFLGLEEDVGARSTNFIVPCQWPLDHSLLGEVVARGHELGVHGFAHENVTAFLSPAACRERLQSGLTALAPYPISGYRAPSLLRTPTLLDQMAGLYSCDSSIPTSGGLFPIPNNGCASARPFFIGPVQEIPLSMPRDGSLRFLGYTPEEMLRLWIQCSRTIAASGGVVVLLTHCEDRFSGNHKMIEIYQRFLKFIAQSGQFCWRTLEDFAQQAPKLRATVNE